MFRARSRFVSDLPCVRVALVSAMVLIALGAAAPLLAGGEWLVSDEGKGPWVKINSSCIDESKLRAGRFFPNSRTDVFTANAVGGQWHVSVDARSKWQKLNTSSIPIDELRLGDFDGDGYSDVFTCANKSGYWHISYGGNTPWKKVNKSSLDLDELRFGDHDKDGSTDVFGYFAGTWHVSYGATTPWKKINYDNPGSPDPALDQLRRSQYIGNGLRDRFRVDTSGCSSGASSSNEPFEFDTCGTLECPGGYHPISYSPGAPCSDLEGNSDEGRARCRETIGHQITTCGTACPAGYGVQSESFSPTCDPFSDNAGAGAANTSDPNQVTCTKGTGSTSSGLTAVHAVPHERPAVYSRASGQLDVVGRGMDDRFYLSSWNGQAWSGWAPIGVGEFRSGPAVGRLGSEREAGSTLSAYGRGKDDRFYEAHWNGRRWSHWSPVGDGTFLCAPALLDGSRPHLVGCGKDRRMWFAERTDGGWSAWRPIGDGTFTSDPAVVRFGGGLVDVYALGEDRAVYGARRGADGRWSAWSRIGVGTFRSAPTAVSWGPDRLDLFAVGDDSKMWQNTWTPAGWSGWFQMDGIGVLASPPSAISTAPQRIDLIAVGMDRRIYHKAWLGDRWTPWLADTPHGQFR